MRARIVFALLGMAGFGALVVGASAQAPVQSRGQCTPQSIGLARTIEIDTKGGPRFGGNQYPGKSPLKPGEVVLTFDDGPHKVFTQTILDTLDAHCTKATFFMVGQRALHYPEMVRKVAARGHTIATHTWSHQNLAKIPAQDAKTEIELGISAVQKAVGSQAAPFFRFPYLSDPQEMRAHLKDRNTGIFSIDVDSYDFKTRSPTAVIRNVMQQLESKRQGIILFHDIQPSTAGALSQLLSELMANGYRVVHMVPKTGQTTIAEYDKMADRNGGGRRVASLPVPVAQRGIVSPTWEVQVYRGQGRDNGLTDAPRRPAAAQPAPIQPEPARRPARRDDDWRSTIFRNW